MGDSGSRTHLPVRLCVLLLWALALLPWRQTQGASAQNTPPAPLQQTVLHPERVPHAATITASVPLTAGWNLIDLPLQAGISSASALITAINTQLGPGKAAAVATYSAGRFLLVLPGYSADLPLAPAQGIFLLSQVAGTWRPSGTAYTNPQPVYLQSGWNLVAAPFPSTGIDTATMAGEIGAALVKEIATYGNASYQTWLPGNPTFTVSSSRGMWVLSASPIPWSPIPPPPPDPVSVAPPVDQSVPTDTGSATQFLYSGNNPIQTGVVPGTIVRQRAAVLRGQVTDAGGVPLYGVLISIVGHPELGQTESRVDGRFDLAVNGGGALTVDYQKNGYLEAQRQVNAPWQDYAGVPDVVMLPQDAHTTQVTLLATTSQMQVAQGSTQTDSSGSRRATLFFQPGTTATMTLPDGSTQPLSTGHVRATEYSVGSSGPSAMPGTLPSTDAYAYAANFSVDEAQQVGATNVQFTKPVISYTPNFLRWPVGLVLPSLYLDHKTGHWVDGPTGRVVKILSVTGGKADLDVDGTGTPATAATLAALGISDTERQQLATTFGVGQSFWRVPLNHFTDYDF